MPVAPKLQRKATAKTATPGIKPVVPVLSASVAPKAVNKALQPSENQTSDIKDLNPFPVDLLERRGDFDAPHSTLNADGKGKEARNDDILASAKATGNAETIKTGEKRGRPEKLDLGAVKESSKHMLETAAIQDASITATVDLKPHNLSRSQPATPATIHAQPSAPNSARKTQHKTIRLTETPKHEISSPGTVHSQGSGQASRRPSITSLNRPETPTSEKISDNVSYTSPSISRANSPPPNKVGSVSTRRVTKSQQKKERQERAKKAEEEANQKEEVPTKVEEPVVQAPIIGRKKKTKKTKEKTGTTADSTPSVTRPPSPEPREAATKEMPPPQFVGSLKSSKESNKQTKLPPMAPLDQDSMSSVPRVATIPEPDPGAPALSTVADVFASLQNSGELSPNVVETLFKPVTGASHRFDHNLDPELILRNHNDVLKLEQISQLDNDQPVVTVLNPNNASLVLPNRRCLKGLTPAQANRYRDLYLRGARAIISPTTKDSQESVDRLMPMYQTSSERIAPAAPGSVPSGSTSTPQLNNRFADQSTLQALPPAPLSVRLDASAPRSLLGRSVGHSASQYQADKRGMELEEAELALATERKNTEALEKRLNALIRKNRRLVLGSGN